MHALGLLWVVALAAIVLPGGGIGPAALSAGAMRTTAPPADTSLARAMLDAINAERSRHGVGRLTLDSRLARAAAAQAQDLASHGRFSHTGSDGSSVGDRATRAGYRWSRVGENLARAEPTASAGTIVRLWMNSRAHRANMLNGQFTQMGVARQGRIWVLVLARPERAARQA